jgi:nucleotide-binding universal stress UspA family protein
MEGEMSGDPIVVGTDGSASAELAVDRAGELGKALDACVCVVSAYSSGSAGEPAPAAGAVAVAERSGTERAEVAEAIVAKSRARLDGLDISVRTHVSSSDPAQALVAIAQDEHAQMIVVGNRGMTGPRRILGSVPNDVSHHARRGVLIVPTQLRSRPGGAVLTGGAIVVGTDGSATAQLAVKESIRLAKALGGELHITSSYKPLTGVRISGAPPAEAEAWGVHPDFRVDAVLDEAAANARVQGVTATTHALKRDPTDALLEVAAQADAAMVVVGSRGMHGLERLTVGNVPNQISHKGLWNVLIAYTGEPEASRSAT